VGFICRGVLINVVARRVRTRQRAGISASELRRDRSAECDQHVDVVNFTSALNLSVIRIEECGVAACRGTTGSNSVTTTISTIKFERRSNGKRVRRDQRNIANGSTARAGRIIDVELNKSALFAVVETVTGLEIRDGRVDKTIARIVCTVGEECAVPDKNRIAEATVVQESNGVGLRAGNRSENEGQGEGNENGNHCSEREVMK